MTTIEIEIKTRGDGTETFPEDVVTQLPRRLADLGAIGPVVSVGGPAGAIGAAFGLEVPDGAEDALTFPTALRKGIATFDEACRSLGLDHGGVARGTVLTDEMLDRELAQEPETYLGVTELARTLGVSRQRVAELRVRPDFPAPVASLAAGPVWRDSTLRRFVEGWERRPGRPRKRREASA